MVNDNNNNNPPKLTASDLKPIIDGNAFSIAIYALPLYANDTYLIVPDSNDAHIDRELHNIESWAIRNNLVLNKSKSQEMIVYSNSKLKSSIAPLLSGIKCVDSIKILGVTVHDDLTMHEHVEAVCQTTTEPLCYKT